MRGISLICSLIGISLALVITAPTDADAQTTALRGARVIDGSEGDTIDNAIIVIRDGRIVSIGPSAGTPVPSGAEVVDYTGKTIIPGPISNHSHVGIFVGLKGAPENYNRDAILRQLKQLEAYGVSHAGIFVGLKGAPENYNRDAILRQLKQLEAYGVTTVMALGLNGPLFYELRPELHAGRLPGADLFGADQGIGVVGGQPFGSQSPV